MDIIFEVIDKTGRKIHLSKERWSHITMIHSEMSSYRELRNLHDIFFCSSLSV